MTDTTIETTVDQFVNDEKGFTSVDIANSIKTAGTWIGNSKVASWLRKWTPPSNYGITKVTVQVVDTGATAQAGVYLPDSMAVSDYTATATEAMTPAQFQTLHGVDPFASADPVVDPVVASAKDSDASTDTKKDGAPTADASAGDKLRTMFQWPKTAK
jgi:hypothetical protein